MSKRLLALVGLAVVASGAFAQTRWGQVEIEFFRVRGEDGRMIELPCKGVVLPVKFEAIHAVPKDPIPSTFKTPGDFAFPEATTVYQNDKGNGNYFYDPDGPSACDDITILPSGVNQNWYDLTLGVHTLLGNPTRKVMLRHQGWNNYVAGLGEGVSALSQMQFDVGWSFVIGQFPPDPDPGGPNSTAWKFTIPIHNYWGQLGADLPKCPNTLIYMVQQWREWHVLGEGAFITSDFSPVFCGGGDPTIGASTDNYIGDYNNGGPNGVYDETENDYFGGPPNEANFLMTLTTQAGGVQEVVRPATLQLFRGTQLSGNIGSTYFVDTNYYQAGKGFVANFNEKPIQIIMEGFVSTSNLTSLSIDVSSLFSNNSFDQSIEAWNYSTQAWVLCDNRAMSTTELRITVGVPGTASQFVDAANGNVMKMRVAYKQRTFVPNFSWSTKLNLANWVTTHP